MGMLHTCAYSIVVTVILAKDVHEMEVDGVTKQTWKNCNSTAVPIWFTQLDLTPDPIQLGSILTVTAGMNVISDVVGPVEADISIKLKIEEQYTEMCDLIAGLCHKNDLCQMLGDYFKKKKHVCPDIIEKQGSNCTCPIKPNTYSVKNFHYPIEQPPFEIYGTFEVNVRMKSQGREMGCINVQFCLGKCS